MVCGIEFKDVPPWQVEAAEITATLIITEFGGEVIVIPCNLSHVTKITSLANGESVLQRAEAGLKAEAVLRAAAGGASVTVAQAGSGEA